MTINWGIVGCGDIANKRVAPAINQEPNSVMHSFCSRSIARAEEMCERHGGKAYDDFEAFLADPELDVVYVASPVNRHCAETVAAARAKKHVLCEKPMALDVEQCRRMIFACEANEVRLAVAYYRRWYPKARKMKELIDAGAVGQVIRARICVGSPYNPALADPQYWRVTMSQAGGGAMMDVGSHRLDVICYLLGEPEVVIGFADRLAMSYDVPDTETLICKMKCGAHVCCEAQWNIPTGHDEMEIHGTEGSLVTSQFDGPELSLMTAQGEEAFELPPHPTNVHYPLIESFARAIIEDTPSEFDGADGMQATRIIWAGYESARTGRAVRGC